MKEIRLPYHDLVITLDKPQTPRPVLGVPPISTVHSSMVPEDYTPENVEEHEYLGAVRAIELLVLSHAIDGIDVEAPAYVAGIKCALDDLRAAAGFAEEEADG